MFMILGPIFGSSYLRLQQDALVGRRFITIREGPLLALRRLQLLP